MPTMRRAINAYGQASETLAPAQQIVLLYEGAIRRIREARRRSKRGASLTVPRGAQGDRDHRGAASCLDHARGEIARNLDRIYTHVIFRLQRINLTDDPAICDEVIARLDQLRAAWAQLAGAHRGGRETRQAA